MPFCKKCGSELESSDAFCPMCGEKNDLTVISSAPAVNVVNQIPRPVQPAPAKQEPSTQEPKTAKKNRTPIIIGLCAVVLALIGSAIFVVIKLAGLDKKSSVENSIPPEYTMETVDPQKYYEEKSEIKSVIPVNEYEKTLSEKEVIQELQNRGFTDVSITTQYSIKGDVIETTEPSPNSSEKHPMYRALYSSKSGEMWSILVVGDKFMAIPLTFNSQLKDSAPVRVSEDGEILTYEISNNSYYKTVPHNTELRVRKVDRIDAATIDSLTAEVLSNG